MAAICAGLALPLGAQQDSSPPPAQQNSTAQQPNPPGAKTSTNQKSAQPQQKPSASEQNPFPEAQSEAAAHQAPQPADDSTPSAPAPQTAPASGQSSDSNPFPETQSEKAAQQDGQPSAAPQDKPDPNSSSSRTGLKFLDVPGDASANNAPVQSPQLAVKDTQVGTFYLKTGDYKGAYDRFVEAARVDPGNADAVFGLAEAARRLNHRDEAIRNYQLYLTALPNGPRAKEARKALKEMGAGAGS